MDAPLSPTVVGKNRTEKKSRKMSKTHLRRLWRIHIVVSLHLKWETRCEPYLKCSFTGARTYAPRGARVCRDRVDWFSPWILKKKKRGDRESTQYSTVSEKKNSKSRSPVFSSFHVTFSFLFSYAFQSDFWRILLTRNTTTTALSRVKPLRTCMI